MASTLSWHGGTTIGQTINPWRINLKEGLPIMQRREISKALLASAASSALVIGSRANAQACTAPCYARTVAETSMTLVDMSYPPGYVDRYGTNSTPGTTNMTPAFNAAVAVAAQTRCIVRWGATAPYRLNTPVNCTAVRGVVFEDESSCNASAGIPSVIIAHTGHGFDLSASTECVFNNIVISNLAGTVPKTAFFMARNPAGSGAGLHRFNNIRTPSDCTFSNTFYSYGSEENIYSGCVIYNNQAGSCIFNHNSTNASAYTSSFVTIATGSQSNAVHRHVGGEYFNFGNSGSANEVVFQLEGASNFTFRDGLWFCPNGLAYVRVIGSSIAIGWLTLDSIRGEPGGAAHPVYGVTVVSSGTTGVNSHTNWTFNNVWSDSSQEAIRFADSAEIQNLALRVTGSQSGKLLSVYNMSKSIIEHSTSAVVGRAGGTVANNTFVGTRSNITLSGTDSLNTGFDQTTGEYWSTNDRYTSASAACVGALSVAASWKLVKTGQQVTLTLPATVGTATSGTSFAYGIALPTTYRPAADLRFPCIVENNGVVANQPGFVLIAAATGTIYVFRDIAGTASFTASAIAGLPAGTSVSWRL